MTHDEIVASLQAFVGRELLEGNDADLEPTTRLIELGVIDSLAIVGLLAFVAERYGLEVPLEELTSDNLETLDAMAVLLLRLGVVAGAPLAAVG